MKKSVSTVGICCRGISFQLFKHSWEKAGLEPDKILKDKNGLYYLVFEDIVWDDSKNRKTKGLFEVMDLLDLLDETRMLPMGQAGKALERRNNLILPILHTLYQMIDEAGIILEDKDIGRIESDALTSNLPGVGGLMYKCLEINRAEHDETVYIRGCEYVRTNDFKTKHVLVLPDDAVPV